MKEIKEIKQKEKEQAIKEAKENKTKYMGLKSKPNRSWYSDEEEIDNNIIVNSAQQCTFQETNQDGNTKKKFKFNCKSSICHVFKYNFNDF